MPKIGKQTCAGCNHKYLIKYSDNDLIQKYLLWYCPDCLKDLPSFLNPNKDNANGNIKTDS